MTTRCACLAALLLSASCAGTPLGPGQPVTTPVNAADYERLLQSYAVFKSYGPLTLPEIEQKLGFDRLNTVQSLLRASMTGLAPGDPVIARIEGLTGIWGARPGREEGRHQFRLSVRWKPGLRSALNGSEAFDSALGAHVLLPVATGGDDDGSYTGFVVKSDARTWRQVADDPPRLQLSMLKSDELVGEIDLDYDTWVCHMRPANSDAGSRTVRSHVDKLNAQFQFGPPLVLACQNTSSHCKKSYSARYCN